jgi:deazaflavin-dependent oxidoreductase (nitroreductase family)
MSPLLRRLFHAPIPLFHRGWQGVLGRRFLLLIHTGRNSGLRRETVLEVVEYREGPEVVVMSAYGRKADWLRNIEAGPDPEVIVGRDRFIAAHRVLGPDEALRVVADYESRNRLIAPVVRLVLSRFLGWNYGASDADRRRLVGQLPLVSFRRRT